MRRLPHDRRRADFGSIGPDLTHLADVAGGRVPGLSALDYVMQSVRYPSAFTVPGYDAGVMPTLDLSATELAILTEFLLQRR